MKKTGIVKRIVVLGMCAFLLVGCSSNKTSRKATTENEEKKAQDEKRAVEDEIGVPETIELSDLAYSLKDLTYDEIEYNSETSDDNCAIGLGEWVDYEDVMIYENTSKINLVCATNVYVDEDAIEKCEVLGYNYSYDKTNRRMVVVECAVCLEPTMPVKENSYGEITVSPPGGYLYYCTNNEGQKKRYYTALYDCDIYTISTPKAGKVVYYYIPFSVFNDSDELELAFGRPWEQSESLLEETGYIKVDIPAAEETKEVEE